MASPATTKTKPPRTTRDARIKAGKTVFIVGTLARDIPGDGPLPQFVGVLVPGLLGTRRIEPVPIEAIALP
jgi:hypothetical protein